MAKHGHALSEDEVKGTIEFKDVTFRYPARPDVQVSSLAVMSELLVYLCRMRACAGLYVIFATRLRAQFLRRVALALQTAATLNASFLHDIDVSWGLQCNICITLRI